MTWNWNSINFQFRALFDLTNSVTTPLSSSYPLGNYLSVFFSLPRRIGYILTFPTISNYFLYSVCITWKITCITNISLFIYLCVFRYVVYSLWHYRFISSYNKHVFSCRFIDHSLDSCLCKCVPYPYIAEQISILFLLRKWVWFWFTHHESAGGKWTFFAFPGIRGYRIVFVFCKHFI